MSIDSPTATETFSSVAVAVVNDRDTAIEAPLTPISGTGNIIEVKLKGRKTLLNGLRDSDIEAYVDVSDVQVTGKGVYSVFVHAPEGTVIEDYYPKEITVYMDKRSSVTVPVQAQLTQYSLVTGYTVNLSSPTLSMDSIQVSGPESELKKIDYAKLAVSFPGTVTRSFTSTGPLTLVDENGNEIYWTKPGIMRNVTIKNMHILKNPPKGYTIEGYNADFGIENLVFDGLYVGGKRITDIAQMGVKTNNYIDVRVK
jgi:YbbR domain-containing protein